MIWAGSRLGVAQGPARVSSVRHRVLHHGQPWSAGDTWAPYSSSAAADDLSRVRFVDLVRGVKPTWA